MAARPPEQFLAAASDPIYVIERGLQRGADVAEQLRRGLASPVETLPVESIPELEAATAAGVVCPCSSPPDGSTASRAEPEADDGGEDGRAAVPSVVESVVATGVDAPVLVVGDCVDVAAAYDAGATDVVPLRVSDHPETVVNKVGTVVDRSRNERVLSDLIDETTDGMLIHDPRTGEILACNERFYRMLGYDPATDTITLDDITGHDTEFTKDRAVSLIREAADGTPATFEWKDPTNDGQDLWVEVKLEAARLAGHQYVIASVRDIGLRKERERELYIKQRALEEASIPLTLSDPSKEDNPLVYVNDAFEELTGYDAADAVGRNCRFLQGPDTDPETVDELRAKIEAEEPVAIEIRNYRADGSEFWNWLSVTPIYGEDGSLLRYLGSQRDVSERRRNRRIREQLLSTTRELMDAGSRDRIAHIVSEAADSVLGYDLNAVYLRTDDTQEPSLTAVAWPDRTDELYDGPPPTDPSGPVWEAFETGEPVIRTPDDAASERDDPASSLLVLPLGDHGVLALGSTDSDAFGEVEMSRARLLTVNATAAFDRTERRQELERYETLFETVRDKLYVIDNDGYIEMVSQPLAEAVGYEPDELRGRHVSEFLTEETVADGKGRVLDLLVTPDGVSSTYEGTLEHRDGRRTPVEIELSLLPYDDHFRGTVGAVRDISERRQREEELRIFRQALTEAGVGLAMYDESGRFEYANEHYAQLLGRPRDAIEGLPVWEAFEALTRQTFDSYWESFVLEETRSEETEHRRDDGSTVPVETVTTAVEVDGTKHHILTVREITERQERRQQSEVLHRLLRHNLRNDLTVILGHSQMLRDALDGEHAESAETISETADRLRGLADTAQEAQEIIDRETVRKPIDVVELLEDETERLRAEFEVTVETDLPETRYVLADALLRQAIRQLLSNAVEHNDGASPTVWVRVGTAADRSGWVDIEIADDGPGMPENEVATLTAGEETPLQHGSGIGLWIIHWVVTRYGGDLEFEPRDGGGSLVRIKLPAADRQSGAARGETYPVRDGGEDVRNR